MTAFVDDVLVGRNRENVADYISTAEDIEHNPHIGDGLEGLTEFMDAAAEVGTPMIYKYVYKILAQGNLVVSYCLAQIGPEDHAVFDLFRVADGMIVEHWDADGTTAVRRVTRQPGQVRTVDASRRRCPPPSTTVAATTTGRQTTHPAPRPPAHR